MHVGHAQIAYGARNERRVFALVVRLVGFDQFPVGRAENPLAVTSRVGSNDDIAALNRRREIECLLDAVALPLVEPAGVLDGSEIPALISGIDGTWSTGNPNCVIPSSVSPFAAIRNRITHDIRLTGLNIGCIDARYFEIWLVPA